MDQDASKGKALLFPAGQKQTPLLCFVDARNEMLKAIAHQDVMNFLV